MNYKIVSVWIGVAVLTVIAAPKFIDMYRNFYSVRAEPQTHLVVLRVPRLISVLSVGDGETVRIIAIPDPVLQDEVFDTRCLIYTNDRLRQIGMRCLPRITSDN